MPAGVIASGLAFRELAVIAPRHSHDIESGQATTCPRELGSSAPLCEVSFGVMEPYRLAFDGGSINASVGLGISDLAALTTEVDVLRIHGGPTETGWYAGARFGGWASLAATGVLTVLSAAAASSP